MTTTTSFNDDTVDALQDLLSVNIDSQRGFEEAAELTNDTEIKSLFRDFSQRRAHNAAELRQYISAAGIFANVYPHSDKGIIK